MIQVSIDGAPAAMASFRGRAEKIPSALARAINRTIGSVRTVMVREIAGDIGLASKVVRDALSLREAVPDRPEATLGAKLKRTPLIAFGASGPEPSRGRGRGVSYKLSGSRDRIQSAFIATMPSGHRGVFIRKARARLGIRELFGPSIGHVFGKYRPAGLARAREVLVPNMRHELEWSSGGAGASVQAVGDAGAN